MKNFNFYMFLIMAALSLGIGATFGAALEALVHYDRRDQVDATIMFSALVMTIFLMIIAYGG